MREKLNKTGIKPIARRRMTKPGRKRYKGVAKRLTERDAREDRANAELLKDQGSGAALDAERSVNTSDLEALFPSLWLSTDKTAMD